MGRGPKWKQTELENLKGMSAAGWTVAEMAESLGRPEGGVRARMRILNMKTSGQGRPKKVRWTAEEDTVLVAWAKEAKSNAWISKQLGRTEAAVAARLSTLRKRGIAPRRLNKGRRSVTERQEAKAAMENTMTVSVEYLRDLEQKAEKYDALVETVRFLRAWMNEVEA